MLGLRPNAFADDGASNGRAASYLTNAAGGVDVQVWYRLNLTPAGANDVFEGVAYQGLTRLVATEDQEKLGGIGDYSSVTGFTVMTYVADDKIWISIENDSAAADLPIRNANVAVQTIG